MRNWRFIIGLAFFLIINFSYGQKSFQKGRKSFQKGRFNKITAKYGKACSIFEKKRIKGERKPLINLGLSRKPKRKIAEQN